MADYSWKEMMAVVFAREIKDTDKITSGAHTEIFFAATMLAQKTHAPNLKLQLGGSVTLCQVTDVEIDELPKTSTGYELIRYAESVHDHPDTYLFYGAPGGKVGKGEFYIGSTAHDANDHFLWDKGGRTLYYDPDGDDPAITSFTPPVDQSGRPGQGVVSCGPGTCSYTAPPGFFGTERFTYTIEDFHGGTASGEATVTVVQNRAPTAGPAAPSIHWHFTVSGLHSPMRVTSVTTAYTASGDASTWIETSAPSPRFTMSAPGNGRRSPGARECRTTRSRPTSRSRSSRALLVRHAG